VNLLHLYDLPLFVYQFGGSGIDFSTLRELGVRGPIVAGIANSRPSSRRKLTLPERDVQKRGR